VWKSPTSRPSPARKGLSIFIVFIVHFHWSRIINFSYYPLQNIRKLSPNSIWSRSMVSIGAKNLSTTGKLSR
jgi:hypothetical protein